MYAEIRINFPFLIVKIWNEGTILNTDVKSLINICVQNYLLSPCHLWHSQNMGGDSCYFLIKYCK